MAENLEEFTRAAAPPHVFRQWFMDKLFMGMSVREYSRSIATPFNLIAALILAASAPVFYMRYVHGLASVVDASNYYPWGILLSWGIFAGEPLYACGFVMAAAYYIFGIKSFRPFVRVAVLGGMLGYIFAASYLLIDLGRPWRIYYPTIVNFGTSSVLFIIAWHVVLYITVQVLEFSPTILEWLGAKRLHAWAVSATVGLVVGGIILSTVHQSALGALYLMTPGKVQPLWYSSYLPVLFFSSAVYCAMSFAILLVYAGVRYFKDKSDEAFLRGAPALTLKLGKGAAIAMYVYFALKVLALAMDNRWAYLFTGWGYWYLVELLGFVAAPMLLLTLAVRRESIGLVRFAALWAAAGVVLNRFNVNIIAYNWYLPQHFEQIIPAPTEVMMVVAMVTFQILCYRWIWNRFPVTRELPEYRNAH
ncbi:MAG: polysulfide reductase NrfD [Nitrospiraceae bacterium]|nr:polysulfide reductase NrfD [Nitrospiraceae bacterium]